MRTSNGTRKHHALIALAAGCLLCVQLAQGQPLVRLGIVENPSNEIEFRLLPNAGFGGVVSATVITLRWVTTAGVSVDGVNAAWVDPAYDNSVGPLVYNGMLTNGIYSYAQFTTFGLGDLGSAWQANTEIPFFHVPYTNTSGACVTFELIDDAFESDNNIIWYISLYGVESNNGFILGKSQLTGYPSAICQNVNTWLNGAGQATVSPGQVNAGASTGCGSFSSSVTPSTFTCANIGGAGVQLTLTYAGNVTRSCNAVVTVLDSIRPVVTNAPGSLNASLDCGNPAGIAAALALVPTGTDNCGTPAITLISDATVPHPTCPSAYVRTRTWRFGDASGNSSSPFSQTIAVVDGTAPALVAGSIAATYPNSTAAQLAAIAATSMSDNCTATQNLVKIANATGGTCNLSISVTVTDACGNSAQVNYSTTIDTDGDAVCDANDNCPNVVGQIGSACNDGNVCTINDVLSATCTCTGTFQDTDGDGICNANDNCPTVPGQIGSSCNDGNPNTSNDVLNASCVCAGTGNGCATNQVTLTLNTDANASQTTWDVVISGTNTVICSGGGAYANNSTITAPCALCNGCYDLRVFDSFGDGIVPGGYVLRDAGSKRIIDNANNGSTFSVVSQSFLGFCLPLGTDALLASSCDLENATITNTVLRAQLNPAVTSLYGSASVNANTGYQFWVTNPNGGYSRRILFTHTVPGTGATSDVPAAEKASYFKLSSMNVTAPFIPPGILLNVRVRTRQNGVFNDFGPACRLFIPLITCQTTQLTQVADPVISCGATGLTVSSRLWATGVLGATNYQFEFSRPGYLRRLGSTSRSTLLSFVTLPLLTNTCYSVRVRVSFDGASTYCPFGPSCTMTMGTASCTGVAALAEQGSGTTVGPETRLSIWPNPNDGSQVNLWLTDLDVNVSIVCVDVMDIYGKFVSTTTLPARDGYVKTELPLEDQLAPGLYLVTITAGVKRYTERLIIQ